MIIISHRGNLHGPNSVLENNPKAVYNALNLNFECEIDVRYINNNWWLGHDDPQYKVEFDFLLTKNLWVHCKNSEALHYFAYNKLKINYFWHETDSFTITSNGIIWTYPEKELFPSVSIAVLPEKSSKIYANQYDKSYLNKIYGICTDYPINYSDKT